MRYSVTERELTPVLARFGIHGAIRGMAELLHRFDTEDSQEVRLIVRVDLADGRALVVKLLREENVTQEGLTAQGAFSEHLRARGVDTPRRYRAGDALCLPLAVAGRQVLVTVEDFMPGEMTLVTEADGCHVAQPVIFDPLAENDLMDPEVFRELLPRLSEPQRRQGEAILHQQEALMQSLAPLARRPRYAVQGDMSNCNLYRTPAGGLGCYDYNNCGNNTLLGDMALEAYLVCRLLDDPAPANDASDRSRLALFVAAYDAVRPLSAKDRQLLRQIAALTEGFWPWVIRWEDGSLHAALERGDGAAVDAILAQMAARLRGEAMLWPKAVEGIG